MLNLASSDLAAIAAKAQAWADIFKLPLQHRTWRGQTGDFQGSGVGSSLDFQDHRSYVPGDDPRHINWQAYARTGNYSMKLYREEVRPLIDVVFDLSDSMLFDTEKERRSVELFYFVVFAALKSGASVASHIVRADQNRRLTDDLVHGHAWPRLLEDLAPTGPAASPDLRPIPFRARSLRILVSDLLFTEAPDFCLRALTRGGGHGIILAPFLKAESAPEWEGNYEFIEAESKEKHAHRVDRALLQRYLSAYRRHFDLWKTLCRKYDVVLSRVPSESDFQSAIQFEAINSGALEIWA